MVLKRGLVSFLIIILMSLIMIAGGMVIFIESRDGFNLITILGIVLVLVGMTIMFFSKRMCIRNVRLKGNINATPLSELHMSQDIKSLKDIMERIESFKKFTVNTAGGINTVVSVKRRDGIVEMLTGVDSEGSNLEVRTCVFDSIERASKSYEWKFVKLKKEYGVMKTSGTGSDRYFITYINQLRASAESLYELTDSYMTYVYFQKGNIIISLWEVRGKSESKIEQYIKLLSDRLEK